MSYAAKADAAKSTDRRYSKRTDAEHLASAAEAVSSATDLGGGSSGARSLQQTCKDRGSSRTTEEEQLAKITKTLAQTDQIATGAMTKLNDQTEQLERIQLHSDGIEHNLDQSEWLLRGLKGWGKIRNLFSRSPKQPEQQDQPLKKQPQQQPLRGAAGGQQQPAAAAAAATTAQGRAAERLLADEAARRGSGAGGLKFQPDPRVSEKEKAYNQIDNMLDGLLQKTHEINRTLDQHNQMLPEIAERVDKTQERMHKQKEIMKNIR